MFWKKKQVIASAIEVGGGTAVRGMVKGRKTKASKGIPLRSTIMNEIVQLTPGHFVSRELHRTYGGGLAVVELNPDYPGKGEKYVLSTEKIVDGKTTGKRTKLWGTNKAKELADWIEGRCVEKFQSATREKIDDLFFISQLYQDRYS